MDGCVSDWNFIGRLPGSKSILNRLLLIQSYFPELKILGESKCDDVQKMESAVRVVASRPQQIAIDAGSAGTVLRFMALRLSRLPGRHRIVGKQRLFERPQDELVKILRQLGVECRKGEDFLEIEGDGWCLHGDTLLVPFHRSSQFATSVLLNAWDLPFDLYVSLGGQKVSEGYWRMSVRLAQDLGMRLDFWDGDFRIPRGQKISKSEYTAEVDVSSAFALAAIAAVKGSATLIDFPEAGLQPDVGFTEILKKMGVPVSRNGTSLKVERAQNLNGVAANLKNMPDLFPVLGVLCGLASGDSHLYGAPHLVHKESDRLGQVGHLLRQMGRIVELKEDGLIVRGEVLKPHDIGSFSCDHDHRLAFAAAVVKAAGFGLTILEPEVVSKSFPEFWSVSSVAP